MTDVVAELVDVRPKKVKTEEAELDITPMIDIVFLLLAFFVMCSKMDPSDPVAMPKAQYGSTIPEKNCIVLVAVPGPTPGSNLIYKGRSKNESALVRAADPIGIEEEIGQYVESEFNKRPDAIGVMIKGDRETKTGIIELIKRGVGNSPMAQTRQIFIGVEQQR
ncbi:MAG TPA: biopolymer transporter ExbD [Pirellulaceae bacterium]|nr:biopolymer transporter ExbD [Pirellulaceae bacterium]